MDILHVVLLSSALLFFIAVVVLSIHIRNFRVRLKKSWLFRPWPVKKVLIEDLDKIFKINRSLFDKKQEVLIMRPLRGASSTTILESWVLSAAAQQAPIIFEFGTCTGRTTLMLARNSPEKAQVHTLTLDPETQDQYQSDKSDGDLERWKKTALKESQNTDFLYEGTDVAHKVVQYFGDSKNFDETALIQKCNLIFIDGGHSYSYVKSDSEKALRMIAPGGLIFWHDYSHKCPGVFEYLNAVSKTKPLFHIDDTTLVVYQHLPSI